ncbi:CoA transferase [Betaproteobacteria bacterium]|nr:CoA transferase [Betaproteobacteria bacterium]
MALPLDGIRIVDFTIQMQGPQATQMLADMGAEVFKIERPERLGGPSGRVDERYGLTGNYKKKPEENRWYASAFLAHNRNKKSITVDLKHPKGIEIIKRLVAQCDVVYENFRPKVMDKLGIGYDDCAKLNPSIIFASASGYGPDGPYVNRPGQDLLAQGISGFGAMNATVDGRPTTVALSIGDLLGAMYGAYGVMGALYHRQKTGEGQRMSVCLVDSLLAALSEVAVHHLNTGAEDNRGSMQHACAYIPSPYGIYKTGDGFLAISGYQTLPKLSEVLGLPDLTQDSRFDDFWKRVNNRKEMDQVLENELVKKTTAEWIGIMGKADLWCGQVNSLKEAFEDPQVIHNKMVTTIDSPVGPLQLVNPPYKLSKTPATVRMPAPKLGEHTDEILRFAGYGDSEIDALRKEGVI